MQPKVNFKNKESARQLTEKEIEQRIAQGGKIHNTAMNIHEAKKQLRRGEKLFSAQRHAHPHHPPSAQAKEISDPTLDRSCETAVAINPKNPDNIVAGAATFDGTQFANSAYVTKDGGRTWTTVTALSDTDEGAGIAFDDSGHCYYATMQGGFNPCCTVSTDGGLTWSAPAIFGSGDKTAVAARGKIALVGFDRINTEACAFTLDGGATWTVHDFTDNGLGTAPLISYDKKRFYIIYAALDGNIKLYASADQGQTWTGPKIVVAGNAFSSNIPGPLSYQGFALTSPGTNVAIDAKGTLHVLYVDSNKLLPMYTASHDHGNTWSAPINVDTKRASDAHMYPCLSCDKQGNLLGGSLVYDKNLNQYAILRHIKTHGSHHWKTTETDNGPWSAAPAPAGFRIGFGDYFDCDSTPENTHGHGHEHEHEHGHEKECGPAVMAWSETANGQEPWQTWCRVIDSICRERDREEEPRRSELMTHE